MAETTRRTNKDGVPIQIIALGRIPAELHRKVKDRTDNEWTVSDFYSEAIMMLQKRYRAGTMEDVSVPETGRKTPVWLTDEAFEAMVDLANELKGDESSVVYMALLGMFEKDSP